MSPTGTENWNPSGKGSLKYWVLGLCGLIGEQSGTLVAFSSLLCLCIFKEQIQVCGSSSAAFWVRN